MPHAFAADTAQSHLNTTAVTDNILVFDALVLSAGTFPVPRWAENALAEETALFRFESAVVDGFRIFYLPFTPTPDCFRGCYGDSHLVE